MRACVVYESLWGNTAAIAAAIAEGIGPGAVALPTDEATADRVVDADLIVAGAPVMAFRLPTDGMRTKAAQAAAAPRPGDVAHPTMRTWLAAMPGGWALTAAFETRFRWSPGGSIGAIERALKTKGYCKLAPGAKFLVTGTYGPLREGELERARAWGRALAEHAEAALPPIASVA
jgi:hypothetical protein